MALSVQDAARVARGEPTEQEAEDRRRRALDALADCPAGEDAAAGQGAAGGGANDARLLAEVPPHWQ
ncbi:transcriptional regulator [Actinomyces weissii]|uniref:Transcriptional regulator n=1 Tax=Actinomyces weissii TaxID=675090 RepID=A0A7T7S3C1_9ACTO|nr:transcriptional regulator [Actinomyces weissii]